jgi:hypothetical protein
MMKWADHTDHVSEWGGGGGGGGRGEEEEEHIYAVDGKARRNEIIMKSKA